MRLRLILVVIVDDHFGLVVERLVEQRATNQPGRTGADERARTEAAAAALPLTAIVVIAVLRTKQDSPRPRCVGCSMANTTGSRFWPASSPRSRPTRCNRSANCGRVEDEPEDLRDIAPSSPFSSSGR
ncbi:hypothetical protein [Streptomyces mirabilis]|uniref:hypothetical protein n=1 Tax=Streptomyces mirabilis TaxID=68239 RepID=UPI00368EB448